MADASEAPYLFFIPPDEAAKLRDTDTKDLAYAVAHDSRRGDSNATIDDVDQMADALASFAEPGRTLDPTEAGRIVHLAHRALSAVAKSQGAEVYMQFAIPMIGREEA